MVIIVITICMFYVQGYHIYKTFKEAKSDIASTGVCKRYIARSELPSGVTPSGMLQGIRKTLWKPDAFLRARRKVDSAVRNKTKYTQVVGFNEADKYQNVLKRT